MSANKFVLKGSRIEVDYTIGANPTFSRAHLYRRRVPEEAQTQRNPVRTHGSW